MEEVLERTGADQRGRTEPLPEFSGNSAERDEKDWLLCVRKLVDPPQKIEAYYRWRGKTHHRAIRTLQRAWMPFARASGSAVLHKPPMAENFGWARKYRITGEAILKCPSSVTGTDYHRPSLRRS